MRLSKNKRPVRPMRIPLRIQGAFTKKENDSGLLSGRTVNADNMPPILLYFLKEKKIL